MISKLLYKQVIKPFLDLLSAAVLLTLFSPLLLFIVILLWSGGNGVFFQQKRPGLHGRLFRLVKFKTMNEHGEITRLGKVLRRTSLDELPQLFNILKGEMSLIGPRPLFESYLKLYNSDQMRRHDVKPGITGWAQVNGRNLVELNAKVTLDLFYVENLSWKLDIIICWKTLLQLFKWSESDFHYHESK